MQRRIVAAAIRAADGSVIVGIRHYSKDMHEQIKHRGDGKKFSQRHGIDQGFVDQKGVYLTREEAWVVARKAGQIIRNHEGGLPTEEDLPENDKLFSENLY